MPAKENSKIKVLHIITRLIIGGAQENTLLSVINLGKNPKYDMFLLSGPAVGPEGSLIDKASKIGNFFILPELQREINLFYDLIALIKIYRFIKKNKFNIVHTHSSKAGIIGRWAAKLAHTPVIVHTVHGWGHNDRQNPLLRKFYIALEKITLLITDKLIAVSMATMQKGIEQGIGKKDDYKLIRSGIVLDRFVNLKTNRQNTRSNLGIPANVPVIGSIMRLTRQKAPLDFIQAAASIAKIVPEAWFIIVGDGPLRQQVELLSKELDITNRLILTGLRKDIPELLSCFDVFVLCSLWEGLPRVLPQAMASAIPIVATNIDGNKEAVANGENGFLVNPGDLQELTRAVVKILDDPNLALEMGKNSLKRVAEFSNLEMIKRIDALYEELSCGK